MPLRRWSLAFLGWKSAPLFMRLARRATLVRLLPSCWSPPLRLALYCLWPDMARSVVLLWLLC